MKLLVIIIVTIASLGVNAPSVLSKDPPKAAPTTEVKATSDLMSQINSIGIQVSYLKEFTTHSLSEQSRYISIMGWFTGIVIGIVGAVFGIGAYLSISNNKKLHSAANAQLNSSKAILTECSTLKDGFCTWYDQVEKSFKDDIINEHNQLRKSLDQYLHFFRLKLLLEQTNPPCEVIFSCVSYLASDPIPEFGPTFQKIVEANFNQEISDKAQEALNKL